MHWSDEAIIVATRPYGETSLIAELFTRSHGRHLGLVKGGRTRRLSAALQTGNLVRAEWRARLAGNLGAYRIEPVKAYAAGALNDRLKLAGLGSLCAWTHLLPERDPHPALFAGFELILQQLDEARNWPQLLVRWELALLSEMGFGLDLQSCAATGATGDLIYVSPKSGQAVAAAAGEPYKNKLLRLPDFLRASSAAAVGADPQDLAAGFELTGYFLHKYVLDPAGLPMPEPRRRLVNYLR